MMLRATDIPFKFDFTHGASATVSPDASAITFISARRVCVNNLFPNLVAGEDQTWYWTTSWRAGEQEALAQIAAGEGERFASGDDLLAALEDLAQQ